MRNKSCLSLVYYLPHYALGDSIQRSSIYSLDVSTLESTISTESDIVAVKVSDGVWIYRIKSKEQE
ncbi:MAG: hypothetical protein AABW52_03680 [Nanoarchaeota archaeon]